MIIQTKLFAQSLACPGSFVLCVFHLYRLVNPLGLLAFLLRLFIVPTSFIQGGKLVNISIRATHARGVLLCFKNLFLVKQNLLKSKSKKSTNFFSKLFT